MRKIAILLCALSLAGCASQREYIADHIRPQRHVVPAVKAKPAPAPAPIVVAPEPKPAPVVVTPLTKPRWYDDARAAGSWAKSKFERKKGN